VYEKEQPWLTAGKKYHAAIERYLLRGADPGDIMRPGIPYLPKPPVSPLQIERKFAIYAPHWPVLVVGIIDLLLPWDRRVTDHKTAASFRLSHERQSEELREDLQGAIYLLHLHAVLSREHVIGNYSDERGNTYPVHRLVVPDNRAEYVFQWVQYATKGTPQAREVSVTIDGVTLQWAAALITELLDTMHTASTEQDETKVAFNSQACGDYGGCPFAARCALSGAIPL
jgi:hypothetical protein